MIIALGASACPVAETSRIADYFAAESAGQCGPCVNGLGAIAETMAQVARGTAASTAKRDLARWSSSLAGRGACQFPDGATRFVASALRVFADDFDDHRRHGPCERCSAEAVLPTPMAMRVLMIRPSSSLGTVPAMLKVRVNPIQCAAHGLCAELLPERITLDEWGYPILDGSALSAELVKNARRAANACPTLALILEPDR